MIQLGLLVAVFCSCGLTELGVVPADDENGVWDVPGSLPQPMVQSITYSSAFDYPENYKWQSDTESGTVRCSLVVFMEEMPILKVPVGEDYKVSSDPDMHRLIDGHLYTFFASADETVIKKDGRPYLSYPQPEIISDFRIINGVVHTLGLKRDGGGFSYRVEGEQVLSRDDGYVFDRIMYEDTTVCVAFLEPIKVEEGILERYYLMKNGKVSQIALRDDIKRVWDVVYSNGELLYLASLTGVSHPVLVFEDNITALSIPPGLALLDCNISQLVSGTGVEAICSDGQQLQEVVWDTKGKMSIYPKGMTMSAVSYNGDELSFALNPFQQNETGIIINSGESVMMPEGYACMSRRAMDYSSGILSVGLSSPTGQVPVIWKDGRITQLDVNGYISCVSCVQVEP